MAAREVHFKGYHIPEVVPLVGLLVGIELVLVCPELPVYAMGSPEVETSGHSSMKL